MPADDGRAAFIAASQALNEAGDKDIRREVYAEFRKIAAPLGEKVIASGSQEVPRRGGLAGRVAAARMSQSNSTTGRNPGVTLRWNKPRVLRYIDRGVIPHPVFARSDEPRPLWRWALQTMNSGAFTRPFEAGRQEVAGQVVQALQNVANEIAHKTQQAEGRVR